MLNSSSVYHRHSVDHHRPLSELVIYNPWLDLCGCSLQLQLTGQGLEDEIEVGAWVNEHADHLGLAPGASTGAETTSKIAPAVPARMYDPGGSPVKMSGRGSNG